MRIGCKVRGLHIPIADAETLVCDLPNTARRMAGRCVLREKPPDIAAGTLPVCSCVFRGSASTSGNLAYVARIFSILVGVWFLILLYLFGLLLAYYFLRIPPPLRGEFPIVRPLVEFLRN